MASFFANVRDYGAIGNGTADDSSAFNSALAAANSEGGGTVIIPTGTYRVNISISQTTPIMMVGEWGGAKLRSFTTDGWAVKVTGTTVKGWGRHVIRNIQFTGNDDSNGLSIQNAIGCDLEYVSFTLCKIGLLHRHSHYGMHHRCNWYDNDVGLMFSQRGGTVTNPNTSMPEADDLDPTLNNANKAFSNCYFNTNRIGVLVDGSKSPLTYRNRFLAGSSFENNMVGIAVLDGASERQPTILVRESWFEGNGDASGASGSETVFGETLTRGDVSALSGQVEIEKCPLRRIHCAAGSALSIPDCDTWQGDHTDLWTIAGSFHAPRIYTNLLSSGGTDRLSYTTPIDLALPQRPTRPASFVRSSFHGAKAPHVKVVRADDCTGAAFATGFSSNGITPAFQQAGGPFSQMITVASAGGGVGVGISLASLPSDRFYVLIVNIKAAAEAVLDVNSTDWMANGVTIGTAWQTVAWVNYVESAADTSALLQLGTATTYSIAGMSVAVCQHAGEVEALIKSGTLPTVLS